MHNLRKPRPLERGNLWPWRWWVTIGIGCLGSEPSLTGITPNRVVLVADTMGSFGDEDSVSRLHKIFVLPDLDLYVVAANMIDRAALLLPMVEAHMKMLPLETKTFTDIKNAIQRACFFYKRQRFISDVFPKYRLEPNIFEPRDDLPKSLDPQLQSEWESFDIGCDLIFGAFDCRGQASLLYVSGTTATAEEMLFPGFAAIGTGFNNAMFWLGYRKHAMNMSCKLAAFHAYEAKLMAESSPHVNEHVDVLIAAKGKYWSQSTHSKTPPSDDCPITLAELKAMREEYGPKNVPTSTLAATDKEA